MEGVLVVSRSVQWQMYRYILGGDRLGLKFVLAI
jgi:hypothetical protein